MGLNKRKKLRTLFIQYVFSLGFLIVILLIVNYVVLASSTIFYPANYTEKTIQRNYEQLKNSSVVTMDLLTPLSSFGVYSKQGEYLYGNLPFETIDKNWKNYINGNNSISVSVFTAKIEREDDILIINYPLSLKFKNEILRNIIPKAESFTVLFVIFQLALLIFLLSNRFAKTINKELNVLLQTTDKIKEQNLDFEISNSKIEEINIVLKGIDTMKSSLKHALEKQWLLEKENRDQISALAHDIKTPLTIVKGNAELLHETLLTPEQRSYLTDITESNLQMESYIQKLLSFTRNDIQAVVEDCNFSVNNALVSIQKQSEALGHIKDIQINWAIDLEKDRYIKGEQQDFERAIMNIVKNACDYSPRSSTIDINITTTELKLKLQVLDQGKGFSKKALRYGKNQFFMENESRSNTGHHGLGLYITNSIIKGYKGELLLANGHHGGGCVEIIVPMFCEEEL